MAIRSEDPAYDAPVDVHHGFLTARAIEIIPSRKLHNLNTSRNGHDQGSKIMRLCLDLRLELEAMYLLLHEAPNVGNLPRADSLMLRRNLISTVESIQVLMEGRVHKDSR